MLESLKALDTVRLHFSQQGLFILNLALAFIMFGVALGIKPVHFKRILHNPRTPLIGVFSQFVALPAITFLLTWLFSPWITPTVGLGMILVASCPGGNISNFISSLARANAALSVTLTAIATLLAIFMTPLNFAFWGHLFLNVYSHKVQADELLRPLTINPWQMFRTVVILLGIPLVLGIVVNQKMPRFTEKILKPMKYLSIVFFLLIVAMAFKNNFYFFLKYIKYVFIIVLFHNTLAYLTGYSLASVFKRHPKDRKTIAIETGIQNSGLGLVLLFNPKVFPPDMAVGGMAFIAAWWGIWHIISGLTLASIWGRGPKRRFRVKKNTVPSS
jgi:BASS family bile acid:Na+ symporter